MKGDSQSIGTGEDKLDRKLRYAYLVEIAKNHIGGDRTTPVDDIDFYPHLQKLFDQEGVQSYLADIVQDVKNTVDRRKGVKKARSKRRKSANKLLPGSNTSGFRPRQARPLMSSLIGSGDWRTSSDSALAKPIPLNASPSMPDSDNARPVWSP